MSTSFMFLAIVVMLTRIPLLSTDAPVGGRRVVTASLLQLGAMLLLTPTPAVGVTGVLLCLLNAWSWAWEKRLNEPGSPTPRILTGVVLAIVLGTACSPFTGMAFRPDLGHAFEMAGHYFLPAGWLATLPWPAVLTWLCGALLSMGEANLIVRALIEGLALRPKPRGYHAVHRPGRRNWRYRAPDPDVEGRGEPHLHAPLALAAVSGGVLPLPG